MSAWCLQPEIRKVIYKCVWHSFSRSTIKVRWLILGFRISYILDLANVRIDTKIKSVARLQPEIGKVIQLMCDLEFQDQPSRSHDFLTYLIFLTSKMLESTLRSTSHHVYNRRWERSCKKVFDLDFQGHAIKIEFFHYHRWISWPRQTYPWEIFSRNSDGKAKIQGGLYHPLGRFSVGEIPWVSAG